MQADGVSDAREKDLKRWARDYCTRTPYSADSAIALSRGDRAQPTFQGRRSSRCLVAARLPLPLWAQVIPASRLPGVRPQAMLSSSPRCPDSRAFSLA